MHAPARLSFCLSLTLLFAIGFAFPAAARAGDDNLKLTDKDRKENARRADEIRAANWEIKKMQMDTKYRQQYSNYTITSVQVENQSAQQVLNDLRDRMRRAAATDGKTFNMLFTADKARLDTLITLDMQNVPFPDLLHFIGMVAQLDFRFEEHAIVVINAVPKAE